MTMTTEAQLRALTELVHHVRPAWDRHGIYAALHANSARLDFPRLIRAAVDAAQDPDARTPAAIHTRDGQAWHHDQPTPTKAGTPWPPPITDIDLGQPQPEEVTRLGAAAARAALHHATQEQP
jgi:hypothetical protein